MKTWQIWYNKETRKAADQWYRLQCANPYAHLVLWYKEGSLVVAENKPDESYQLGSIRIQPHWTTESVLYFIRKTANRLPVLAMELVS